MLKILGLLNKPVLSKNNSNKLIFNRNNDSKPAFGINDGNSKVNRFGISKNGIKHAKKLEKLFKLRKLKSKKMSKSWNLAKLRKKLSKSRNSTNFDAIKNGSKFFTLNTRIAFNRLWLAFTEALILWHFYLEYYIQIKTNILGYAIGRVLSQLISGTNPNGIVTKTDLN